MKTSKKRFLAILMSLCLATATVCTTIASAAETTTPTTENQDTLPGDNCPVEEIPVDTNTQETPDVPEIPEQPEVSENPEEPDPVIPPSITPGWHTTDGKKYYYDENGNTVIGWKTINGEKYYFNADGTMQTGWKTINSNKYYFGNSGVMRTGWRTIDGNRYYFGNSGVMRTSWRTIDGNRYYFGNSGVMRTGWRTIDNKRYYFNSKGVQFRKKGFQTIEKQKYYFNSDYSAQQNWKTINGKKYYFGKSGVMRTGWKTINNKIYYFDSKGVMQKSVWKTRSGKRYYLKSNGVAATGWTKISGYRYYFSSKGVLDEDVRNRSDVKGPYQLIVSLKECTVIVLAKGTDGVYNIPAAKFVCSPGKASTPTPTGTYTAYSSARWQPLMGPSWGQYGVHVVDGIFFHSIPCAQANIYNVPSYDYYTLGTPASHGCIRLLVRDEKWVYQNAKNGIKVTITNSSSRSVISYLTKPSVPELQQRNGLSWDPTDPIAAKEQKKTTTTTKPASGETLIKYRANDDLNYRSAPTTAGTRKGTLDYGTTVYVVKGYSKTADGMKWYKIKIGTKYYYVASQYLTKIG